MQMPTIITINWGAGRSNDVKRDIVEAIVPKMAEILTVPEKSIAIFFNDIPKDCTATGGKYKG